MTRFIRRAQATHSEIRDQQWDMADAVALEHLTGLRSTLVMVESPKSCLQGQNECSRGKLQVYATAARLAVWAISGKICGTFGEGAFLVSPLRRRSAIMLSYKCLHLS